MFVLRRISHPSVQGLAELRVSNVRSYSNFSSRRVMVTFLGGENLLGFRRRHALCVEPGSISDKIIGDKITDTHVTVIPEKSHRMGHTAITYLYVYAPGQLLHSLWLGYILLGNTYRTPS